MFFIFIFLRWKRVKVFLLASERAKTSFKDRLGATNCRLINSGPKLFTLSMFISVSFPFLVESKRRMYALNLYEKYIMCSGPMRSRGEERKERLDSFLPFLAIRETIPDSNCEFMLESQEEKKRKEGEVSSLPFPPLINIQSLHRYTHAGI